MGVVYSLINEGYPPETKFTPANIPDLTGKVIIVTGANTGVGKETAKALLEHNAKVYIASRNPQKAAQAIVDLEKETGKTALFLKLDLADLKSVKAAAEEFINKETELHVLFNNAGVMLNHIDEITTQGYDIQFGTNVLGHFYFTKLLLPTLLAGAKSSPDGKARIVNTSSAAAMFVGGMDFDTFHDGPTRKKKGSHLLYSQSKLGSIIFSNELARRYGGQGIVSTSLNPGNLDSDLMRHMPSWQNAIVKLILWDPSYGALTQLWAGTTPEGAELNGQYLIPWARIGTANPAGTDPKLGTEMWNWMEEQVMKI
ncbi:NAD(P)-binding protein [Pholiota conissans]|uniref:NAD(P)-binding protein n=1 Tax=Pholiota conissans TaxID=109636 RepID=A0A9P5ZE56_9AGAR|nr:NAD(P)-binding protein [Pholiota conissans]